MRECLAEAPDVIAGDRCEPVADASVDVDALLLGDLASRGRTDQVVGQPEYRASFDGDAARHELARRLLRPIRLPAIERGRVCEGERSPSDR
jgi:hypothetical protein